jgi:1,2-phenylacetyl-CoA epoxidase PaaB subunit
MEALREGMDWKVFLRGVQERRERQVFCVRAGNGPSRAAIKIRDSLLGKFR